MSTYYDTGRRYNITLENALVVGTIAERGGTTDISVKLVGPNGSQTSTVLHIPLDHVGVTVTPVPPSNWPIEVGDVWDGDGHRWFAIAINDEEGVVVGIRLVNENDRCPHGVYGGDAYCYEDVQVLLAHAPDLRLIARKGWPPPEPKPQHPDFTDEPPF
ncbi:hypothetical protein [Nonomuraea sp. SYSU D8015]|uniref:hypothetical protein n=1 Tax=Nonomuraea sp. SYSU D8015 TaxID=2593644 RepID=UPI001660F269|nr:hypothetical protein [Nonomuraea sp. SYSU D8015]